MNMVKGNTKKCQDLNLAVEVYYTELGKDLYSIP
jgi:hypothetical protein